MNNYLLYLAHGDVSFKNEAVSSILSYLALHKNDITKRVTIIIYTDESAYFRQFFGDIEGIDYEEIGDAQQRAWRGEIDFIHRVKIEVIKHALLKYKGNVIFLDSDTYFIRDESLMFAKIANGELFMHIKESILSQTKLKLHKNLYTFLRAHPAAAWPHVGPSTLMYNAGVIGLNKRHISLLTQVLQLTDTLYRVAPSHVVEQFAFSYCFSEAGKVQEAHPYILHYWHMKDARPKLANLFQQVARKPLADIIAAFERLPLVQASQLKDDWEARPRWQRALMRAVGNGWRWPEQHT